MKNPRTLKVPTFVRARSDGDFDIRSGGVRLRHAAVNDGATASKAAASPKDIATYQSVSGVYWINPNVTGWNTAKRCWVDVTRNGGGWVLWGARYSNVSGMDIRSYFSGYTDGTYALSERTDPSVTGHQDYMWAKLTGATELWWVNNISGASSSSAGTYTTSVIHAKENGNAMNSTVNYWNFSGSSCPSTSYRYDYTSVSFNSGWHNDNSSGGQACSGFGNNGTNYIGNYRAGMDCYNCYYPSSALFGNGGSGYYSYGNSYDFDALSFDLSSLFTQTGISNHDAHSNQIWLRW